MNQRSYWTTTRVVFWLSIVLMTLTLFAQQLKLPQFDSGYFTTLAMLSPALVVILAENWKEALRYGFYSTLFPAIIAGFLMFIIALLAVIKNPSLVLFLKSLSSAVQIIFMTWLVCIVAIWPALAGAVVIRGAWSLLYQKKN
jgi:hypothetical protein